MEKLRPIFGSAEKALQTLECILQEPFSIIVRDAAIQRFEYTFEAIWKCLKQYLKEKEGIDCQSSKSCFRAALSIGLLSEKETLRALEMTDSRNLTSHAYHEEVAREIFDHLSEYSSLMTTLLSRMKERDPSLRSG